MPIPEAITDGAWPPRAYQDAYARYGDWDAWFRGDPDLLRYRFAGRGNPNGGRDIVRARPSQYMGGVVGRFSRWMWGAPPSENEGDGRIHAPLPADIARTRANLLFSQPPKLTGPVDNPDDENAEPDKDVTAWLERFYEDGFPSDLHRAAEVSFLGDVYLRPVVDEDIMPGRSFAGVVHADGALPVLRWGRLAAVTFWTCLYADGNEHLRLLEHHGVDGGEGYIEYSVYSGNANQLGQPVDLKSLKSYPAYAGLVTDELLEYRGVHPTKLPQLDVVRIPTAGQQRTFRQDPTLKYLGPSVFDGCEQFFDAYDTGWTSWLRDIRLAKGRIILPDYMLSSNGPGGGASFDAEREVWMALSDLPKPTGGTTPIMAQQFEIRAEAHKATLDEIRGNALQHAGISQQTLGHDDGSAAMTATEAQAKERLSFTTRDVEIPPWTRGISAYAELQMMTDKVNGFDVPDPVRPNVEFGDGVTEAPEAMATTLQLLRAAELISIETGLEMLHEDWTRPQIKAEAQKIKDEQQAALPPDPGGAFGGPPDGPPNTGKGKPPPTK